MISVDWQRVRLVVFDIDGTLYDQRCLRRKMIAELLQHCLRHPGDWKLLRLIDRFRRTRERLAEEEVQGVEELQYRRPAADLGMESQVVREMLEDWMLHRPLKHLRRCRYDWVDRFFAALRERGKTIVVLSDYPAGQKLEALGLEADILVSAVDPEVDRLKPHPAGLTRVLDLAHVSPREGLLIGDRDDRDGESARRVGMAYLLKSASPVPTGSFFTDYSQLLGSLEENTAADAALQ